MFHNFGGNRCKKNPKNIKKDQNLDSWVSSRVCVGLRLTTNFHLFERVTSFSVEGTPVKNIFWLYLKNPPIDPGYFIIWCEKPLERYLDNRFFDYLGDFWYTWGPGIFHKRPK